MVLSSDQALLLAFRAALDATTPSHKPFGEALHDPSQDDMSGQKEEQ
jgi:hypothetical protein